MCVRDVPATRYREILRLRCRIKTMSWRQWARNIFN